MARTDRLTVAEALAQAQLIDDALKAWEQTAPEFVASVGGTDKLARMSEMTCIGPVPRLDEATWQRASDEHLERWERSAHERAAYAPAPSLREIVLPGDGSPAPSPPKRSRWGLFGRG